MSIPRLTAANSMLLVIDVQDKLLAKMPKAKELVRDICFLIDAAQLFSIPVFITEQYPQGLGPTTEAIAKRLPGDRPSKVAFSCCGAVGLLDQLRASGKLNLILVGMETHVCVMQTAFDLITADFQIFLPQDGVSSRYNIDHATALHRMEQAGATITTVEATTFEWLGGANHPQFKAISKLVQERMKLLE